MWFSFRKVRVLVMSAGLLSAGSGIAMAHHSFAMFDSDKTLTLKGTIKEIEWTNPHSWFWITVPNEQTGQDQVWGLEGAAPVALVRAGIQKSDIAPGAKVTVSFHPLKNGQTGGQFLTITLPDGRTAGSLKTPIDQLREEGLLKQQH